MSRSTLFIFLIFGLSTAAVFLLISWRGKEEKSVAKNLSSRPAAVAGSFYPSNKEALNNQLEQFLEKSEKKDFSDKISILLVPHAGIDYSGRIATEGFKQIEGQDCPKVILLGASHRSWFNHVAVYPAGWWETPLGKVAVDNLLAEKIIDEKQNILADKAVHQEEHSLEIELIFLQKVLKEFKIVPILVSNTNEQLIVNLAEKISQNFDEQTLLVISTDLSHYPPYEIAKQADKKIIEGILSGKKTEFEKAFVEVEQKNYLGLETPACAHEAIKIALLVGEKLGIGWRQISYANSGDVEIGDKNNVVGYVALVGIGKEQNHLDENAQKEALSIARKTLENYLTKKEIPQIQIKNSSLEKKLGAFVTLRKNKQLRGCIGSFEPNEPLWQVIQKMAIAAATKDYRFPPVSAEELKEINIEISVMTAKKRIDDWKKIRLGVDGVVIQKGNHSGTFLPQVANETGWSLEEFLAELCSQKASLPRNCYKDKETAIYVFQAQIFEEA